MLRGEQKEGALENVDGENAGELTPIATIAIEDPLDTERERERRDDDDDDDSLSIWKAWMETRVDI